MTEKNASDFYDLEQRIITCRKCPRLVDWRERMGEQKRRAFLDENYWAKPVPGFGDYQARVLVLGLAPGAHGSNRTGRMFTGDASGDFLYPALYRMGFANQSHSVNSGDGLKLKELFITAVCRCAPPDNKPTPEEVRNCRGFLLEEIDLLNNLDGIVALGRIAFISAIDVLYGSGASELRNIFRHGAIIEKRDEKPWILASYHPSRQNTQMDRLTAPMFDAIWEKVNQLLR